MWKRYFGPFAEIIGIDINPCCKTFEEDQTEVRIVDQSDLGFLQWVIDEIGPPDLVIDDGSHMMSHIRLFDVASGIIWIVDGMISYPPTLSAR